ncbi:MAG: RNA-binding protein [Gammaproteobacteria bacterium]|jgi:RNA recognition motif-containing protein|nr:RNA-binding protein [Gammaproteobacteria bacterium]
MAMKLYVGNLSYDVTDAELTEVFSPFGVVESARVVTDRFTGQSKGFGFVEMSTRSEGEKAIRELNGKEHRKRALTVNEARPQAPRTGGPGGGGGGGGRGPGGGGGRGPGGGGGRGPGGGGFRGGRF